MAYLVGRGEQATAQQIKYAESFTKKYPNALVVLLHLGKGVRAIHSNVIVSDLVTHQMV